MQPAIIIDQASAKWELDLNDTKVTIMKMLRITDKKEGKKNFPFTFKTELNTYDRVTNIKKGKVIINNWFANKNWFLFNKNPGAKIDMTCSVKKNIKKDKNKVITKKKLKTIHIKSFADFEFIFFWFTYKGINTLFMEPSAKILLNKFGNL